MADTDASTVAWIFLATSLAGGSGQATRREIADVADAINHAVPLDSELNGSFRYLAARGLIEKRGKSYALTQVGSSLIDTARLGRSTVMEIWKALEQALLVRAAGDEA
jgi:hypothetical protein